MSFSGSQAHLMVDIRIGKDIDVTNRSQSDHLHPQSQPAGDEQIEPISVLVTLMNVQSVDINVSV